jgi:hypothetical protein
MPLTTPRSIVTLALKSAGILGVGQDALAEDVNDTFDVLNGMAGQWSKKRWLVYHLLDIFVTTTGAMSYTVGVGQQFNTTARVDRLEAAFFRQYVSGIPGQTYVDYPLTILQSREDYNKIALKELTSWPDAVFFDSGYPIGNVYPVPIPLQNGTFELHLTIKDVLPQFSSLDQTIDLPDEYKEALWTNLTIRVCAMYPGAQLTPVVQGLAKSSLATISMANAQVPVLGMPSRLVRPGLYNIFSNQVY